MADDFDPYYTWLGIPPEEQPADHYRLLGVRRFESNADVITNAMDQRMHYLRSLQVGKRSALSQKILNEVSSAGVVLLDPKRRAEYDRQLKAKDAKESKAAAGSGPLPAAAATGPATPGTKAARPLPVATSLPKAAPLPLPAAGSPPASAQPGSGVVVTAAPAGRAEKQVAKATVWKSPVVLGGASFAGVAMLGLIGLIVVLSMQGPKPEDNKNNVTISGNGSGKVKPKDDQGNGGGKKKKDTAPAVEPVSVAAWTTDADSQRLFVLDLDKRASMKIDQTAPWVSLAQNTTIEGWFKLRLDSPQTMSLFGTRSGGNAQAPPKGWMLMARRGAEKEMMVDQLVLEAWKDSSQVVQLRTRLARPTDWHHLALVSLGGKEWVLYVDGKEALRSPAELALSVSGADLRLGDDASGRGSGLEGQVCGLRISDTARYQKPFTPPSPLAMTHDEPTAASLHFTMAVPDAAAGTLRRSVSQWQYGYGRYGEGTKKVEGFAPMQDWNGLMWRPGSGLPKEVAEWMFLDPLGGHAGNGQQHAVIRRWSAPQDGTLAITGKLTHAHEMRFGDGIRGRIVSSSAGQAGEWSALFGEVDTPVEKLPVRAGDQIDFVVECKDNNHCDKFAWQVQLALSADDGKLLGQWDSQQDYQGPKQEGAVYQLARLNGARWRRLDPSAPVALTQLAPIASTQQPATAGRVNLIQDFLGRMQLLRGSISRSGNGLLLPDASPTAFTIPVALPAEYVLQAEVVRQSGDESITFGFPVPGDRRMTAIVDGMKGTVSGFASVNAKQIYTKDNPLARQGGLLTNGEAAAIQIEVRQTGATLKVNGTKIADWQNNPSDQVTTAKGMAYPGPGGLAVMTWGASYRINRLEMTPLAASSVPSPPSSASQRVELVGKHRHSVQLVRGSVNYSAAAGWLTQASGTAFTIPEAVPEEYVVEAEVIREEGTGSISFHLPVRGKALSAIVDIYNSRLTGLSDINDWNIQSANNPTVHRGPVLTNGQPAQVRIVVNQQEISLSVDGKKLSSWPYDPSAKLVAYQGLRLPDPRKLGVTTGNSKFRIKRMELIPAGTSGTTSSPPLAASSSIDLIDARRRTVRGMEGSHNVSGGVLTTGPTRSRVVVDHDLPDEYTLEAEVTRLQGNDTLGFGIPIQGRPLCVLIDGWNSARSGICLIPGQDGSNPGGPTIQQGPLLTNGKPARLRIVVSRQEVQFTIDDKTIARWKNDPAAELRAFGSYEPDGSKLAISSFSSYRIANLKLIASGGAARPGSIDLIAKHGTNLRVTSERISRSGNELIAEAGVRFMIPEPIPDEFALDADVVCDQEKNAIAFYFPIQGSMLAATLGGLGNTKSGITSVNGQQLDTPGNPLVREGPMLAAGRPTSVRLMVSKEEVILTVDGTTISRWKRDPSARLEAAFGEQFDDPRSLWIRTWDSKVRITRLVLTSGGSASPLPVVPTPSGFAAKKNPIPDDAARTKAQTQIAAVFGDELKGAKTPQAKATVARKISDVARETKDLATKYVMLEEARKLFVELKDVGSALQTVNAVSQEFDVAPLPAQIKLLETIAQGNLSGTQRAEIVSEACTLGYEAIDSDQFDAAKALADVVRSAAARATSADVKADAKEFIDEFAQRQKRWETIRRAEQTAAANPDDPAANLALGLYHLFDRGDQAKGLAMLAKGSDAKLAAAAKARQETAAKGLAGSLAEADAWFDCLATIPTDYKAAVQKRALEAYELAIAAATGLDKAKAEKRRDQLKADLAATPAAATAPKRGPRIRKSDLPESSPGMVGRVLLGGKDAGILVTFDPQRTMDTQKLRNLLSQGKFPGGRIVLEGTLSCPTPMSMYVSHRGASTAATQQLLVNGKVLSTVGGGRREYDSERLQLVAGNHLVQWIIEFDGSTSPYLHIYEDGNSRRVPLNFSREQNYGARKLTTTQELDLSE